jgi:hypothetical protein
MKKYKINDITVLVNSLIPFKGFLAMAFYNIVFWRKEYETYLIKEHHKSYVDKVINHEDIHVCQMKDFCKWLPIGGTLFYITYVLEWFIRLFIHGPKNAYSNISFEREAKQNERNMNYKNERGRFANFKKYFKK